MKNQKQNGMKLLREDIKKAKFDDIFFIDDEQGLAVLEDIPTEISFLKNIQRASKNSRPPWNPEILPGSGKTNIAKNILKDIEKNYGPTLHLSGDEVRKMLKVTGYTKQERFKIGLKYHKICRKISELGVNVLFDVVCLIEKMLPIP